MKTAIDLKPLTVRIKDEELVLHPYQAIYRPSREALLVADLHLGKTTHFRRNGIAIPDNICLHDLQRLDDLIAHFKPKKLIILGDLFHSFHNPEWEVFGDFRNRHLGIDFILIQGNHDILSAHQYEKYDLRLQDSMFSKPFVFTHEPRFSKTHYNICGHLHPGVRMIGIARQSLRLPCFYFGAESGIMPAFGAFTGLALLKPKNGDRVYIISENEVINVPVDQ